MLSKIKTLILPIILLAPLAHATIIDSGTTNTFSRITTETQTLENTYRPQQILLVFDIDNTLLTTDGDFGSAQWAHWQEHMTLPNPNAIASTIGGIYQNENVIRDVMHMKTTESDVASTISTLQQQGVKAIAETARDPELLIASVDDLKNNGIDFSKSAIGKGYPGDFVWSKGQRDIAYQDGVMLLEGQDKGVMLEDLISHTDKNIKAVIFLDDTQANVDAMVTAFTKSNIKLAAYRYSGMDKQDAKFLNGSKASVEKKWRELHDTLQSTLGVQWAK